MSVRYTLVVEISATDKEAADQAMHDLIDTAIDISNSYEDSEVVVFEPEVEEIPE